MVLGFTGLSKTTLICVDPMISAERTVAVGSTTSIIIASLTLLFAAASAVAFSAAVATRVTLPAFLAVTIPLLLLSMEIHSSSPPPMDQ